MAIHFNDNRGRNLFFVFCEEKGCLWVHFIKRKYALSMHSVPYPKNIKEISNNKENIREISFV